MAQGRRPRDRRGVRVALAALLAAGIVACSDERDATTEQPRIAAALPTPRPKAPAPPTPDRAAAADVVLRHGRIFTGEPARPWVVAVAVKDGRIVAVGSNADVRPFIGEGTRVVQLHLDFVMPAIVPPPGGLVDGGGAGTGAAPDAVAALSPKEAWESIERAVVAVRRGGDAGQPAPAADGVLAAAPAAEPSASPAEASASPAEAAALPRVAEVPAQAQGRAPAGDLVAGLLRAWTIDNARAAGRDAEVGSLAVGKRADILVLDQHPYFAPPETLGDTRPVFVLSDGKVVLDELSARKRH